MQSSPTQTANQSKKKFRTISSHFAETRFREKHKAIAVLNQGEEKLMLDDRKIFLLYLKTKLDGFKTLFEKANEIVIWLVGFSITGSGVLLFKEGESGTAQTVFVFYAKLLFMVTIICGIFYRLLYSRISMFSKKYDGFISFAETIYAVPSSQNAALTEFLFDHDLFEIHKILLDEGIITKDELWTNDLLTRPAFKVAVLDKYVIELLARNYLYEALTKMATPLREKLQAVISKTQKPVDYGTNRIHAIYSYKIKKTWRQISWLILLTGFTGIISIISFLLILVLAFFK